MKRVLLVMLGVLFLSKSALAVNVEGINVKNTLLVNSKQLQLNGYGIRHYSFLGIKIYIGALYTQEKVHSTEQLLSSKQDKAIVMYFLYPNVSKNKIVGAFKEGFRDNFSSILGTNEEKSFLELFKHSAKKGDSIEIALLENGNTQVYENNSLIGQIQSPELQKAILMVYFGPKPPDKSMKEGMLGK
ncbi:putative periplasmic protein [Desulfurella amilsii]|uniref:Putative periplasmic protein n=1 Tax=Desulfurella amilsii TaxID=1562698 RepID=A0A1X4XVI8_9BACT|nr:chalcone isomerase family protein [Desulfurella amilsii]OSS41534.1 putative periplasmic protein [Desulfurella amilsii]